MNEGNYCDFSILKYPVHQEITGYAMISMMPAQQDIFMTIYTL